MTDQSIWQAAEDKRYLRGNLDTHTAQEVVSRSFNFRRADRSNFYFFNLTWSMGKITIFGDMGEIVFKHWNAMPTFEAAVLWAYDSELEYLLSKTKEKRQYNPEETANAVIYGANYPVIQHINEMRNQLSACRRGTEVRENVEDVYLFDNVGGTARSIFASDLNSNPRAFWMFFDSWDGWVKIWKALDGFGYDKNFNHKDLPKIREAAYRRKMREAVLDLCRRNDDAMTDFFYRMDQDDPPISYSYSHNHYMLAAALRWACRRIIEAGFVNIPDAEAVNV